MAQCQVTQGSKSFFAKLTTEYSLINTCKTWKFSKLEMQFFWISHEINLIALSITFEDENAFISNECVPSHRFRILLWIQVIWCWGISINISHATLHRKVGGFLMPLLCVGPSVQNCHRHVKIFDMPDERNDNLKRTTLFLLILVRCVLALSS